MAIIVYKITVGVAKYTFNVAPALELEWGGTF